MVKYSILVVTYNGAKTLKKCLDSIQRQTYKNFEIMVVDDGSIDDTKDIIKRYKNIKYFYKKNSGVADSRNYAISKVKTPYFLFVDSDDYIKEDLLEQCEKYNNYDVLSFKGIAVDTNYNLVEMLEREVIGISSGKDVLKAYIRNFNHFLVPWGYVYNTAYFKKNKFKYVKDYVMEDIELTPIIIFNANKVVTIDYCGYYYVQSNESITRTNNESKILLNIKSFMYHYDSLLKYFNSKVSDEKELYLYTYYFTNLILWYGSTLKDKYFTMYIKELKKRNVIDNIHVNGIIGYTKKILCKIDYRLYYFIYCKLRDKYRSYKKWKKQRKK